MAQANLKKTGQARSPKSLAASNQPTIRMQLKSAFRRLELLWEDDRLQRIVLIISWVVLVAVVVYIATVSSLSHLSTGDQYDSAYPVASWHPGAYLTFFAQHTNLLKLPLLWLQVKLFPFGTHNYVIGNVLYVLAAVAGWSWLTAKLVRKTAVRSAINFAFAGLLLGSFDLSANLVMPTIRNIEYPLFLGYVLLVQNYLHSQKLSRWLYGTTILALLVASDLFFFYTVPVAVVTAAVLLGWRRYLSKGQAAMLALSSITGAIAGVALLKVLEFLGALRFLANPGAIIPYNELWGQVQNGIEQVLQIFGGNFFDLPPKAQAGFRLVLASVAILTAILAYQILRNKQMTHRLTPNARLPMYIVAGMFFVVIAAYIFSGYATLGGANIRYISALPFFGLLLLALQFERFDKLVLAASLLVLLAGLYGLPNTNAQFRYFRVQSNTWVALDKNIIGYLNQEKVTTGYGTLGYASTTWFFSHEKINIYNIQPCNIKNPVLSVSDWYANKAPGRSALIVDRSVGAVWTDESWHQCDSQTLAGIYGRPVAEKVIAEQQGQPIEVLIYDYNIAGRLR